MRFLDIIQKKKHGEVLNQAEIDYFIQGYSKGEIPDYQVAALLMAIYFQGMNLQETAHLSTAMACSGDRVDLSAIPGIKVDKHSTGGVGDKTTLLVAPIVASLGVPVAKMSGRGLGHTGGTIDKLEAIPGLSCDFTLEAFIQQVQDIGVAIAAQSGNLAPADKKLYALRDVTGTVDNISLIASSILSKKIAAGADKVVFDVKCGSGAFMKTLVEAQALSRQMTAIGEAAGLQVHVVISNMNQPLGKMVGNGLEIQEVIQALRGEVESDLKELALTLTVEMLFLAGLGERSYCQQQAEKAVRSGKAFAKLCEMVEAQGGDLKYLETPYLLTTTCPSCDLLAMQEGYITAMDNEAVGNAASLLGAGRAKLGDLIDPQAGLVFKHKIGDYVERDEPICQLLASSERRLQEALPILRSAITVGDEVPAPFPIILERPGDYGSSA